MAITTNVYQKFLLSLGKSLVDFNSDTFKVMLLDNTYTPSSSHQWISDVSGEVSGAGYAAGGTTLTGTSFVISNGTAKFSADNASWANATISGIKYAVVYDDTPSTNKPLIECLIYGEAFAVTASDLELSWPTSGILTIGVSS